MEDMPYDLCSPGLEGPEPSERKEQIQGKGTEIAEDQRQKCKVIGKKRQEDFSGRFENTGNQEAGQDSGERVRGTSESLQLVQGTAGSLRGLTKVVLWSQLVPWPWLKLFECRMMICKGPLCEHFRIKSLANFLLTLGRFLNAYFPYL